MIRVGVIGYGYWGPNIVRNLYSVRGAKVVAVCDKVAANLERAAGAYPGLHVTNDSSELMTFNPD